MRYFWDIWFIPSIQLSAFDKFIQIVEIAALILLVCFTWALLDVYVLNRNKRK